MDWCGISMDHTCPWRKSFQTHRHWKSNRFDSLHIVVLLLNSCLITPAGLCLHLAVTFLLLGQRKMPRYPVKIIVESFVSIKVAILIKIVQMPTEAIRCWQRNVISLVTILWRKSSQPLVARAPPPHCCDGHWRLRRVLFLHLCEFVLHLLFSKCRMTVSGNSTRWWLKPSCCSMHYENENHILKTANFL